MLEQPVDRKRCASCNRWQGPRQRAASTAVVLIESETSTGLCQGGPWDNSERRARSACGHWTLWLQLEADGNPSN